MCPSPMFNSSLFACCFVKGCYLFLIPILGANVNASGSKKDADLGPVMNDDRQSFQQFANGRGSM
jgi:hypothetical protein